MRTQLTSKRPVPGTFEEDVYQSLLPMMSETGRPVDLTGAARLANTIVQHGRVGLRVKVQATQLGLDPDKLPRVNR